MNERTENLHPYVVTCECTDSGPEYMIYSDGRAHRQYEVVMATFTTYAEAVAYKRSLACY